MRKFEVISLPNTDIVGLLGDLDFEEPIIFLNCRPSKIHIYKDEDGREWIGLYEGWFIDATTVPKPGIKRHPIAIFFGGDLNDMRVIAVRSRQEAKVER